VRGENGQWGRGNGEWRVEDGEWRIENGEWRMEESREWRVEDGEWRMENGELRIEMDDVGFLEELLAIPSPSGEEDRLAEYLVGRMTALGFRAHRAPARRPVVR
jgi:hypothetical protein